MRDGVVRLWRLGFELSLVLAAIWASCTFVIWLSAVYASSLGGESEAALTVVALLAQLVSLGLRFGWFARKEPSPAIQADPPDCRRVTEQDEWTWLLAWIAQVNVLGWVSLIGPSLATALPAAIVTFTLEWLVWSAAPTNLHAWWQSRWANQESSSETAGAEIEGSDDACLRSAKFGQLPSGEFFSSGWLRYAFAVGQKSTTLSVAFSPPFVSVPTIELDQESEEDRGTSSAELRADASSCEVNVEHATPAGMRIVLKRTADQPACRGKVHWHATAACSGADDSPALLKSQLP